MGDVTGLCLEERLQGHKHLIADESQDVAQHITYGLHSGHSLWSKGYLKSKFAIDFQCRYRWTLDGSAHEVCVFIERDKPSVPTVHGGVKQGSSSLVSQSEIGISESCISEVEQSVLVYVPKLIKQVEGMSGWRAGRSLVRLQLLNTCRSFGIDQLNLPKSAPLSRGSRLIFPPIVPSIKEDRKLRFNITIPAEIAGQLPNQVIEGRTEIIEALPNEQAPVWGHLSFDAEANAILPGLRIEVSDGQIRILRQEIPDIRIQRLEVGIRPLVPAHETRGVYWYRVHFKDSLSERGGEGDTDDAAGSRNPQPKASLSENRYLRAGPCR